MDDGIMITVTDGVTNLGVTDSTPIADALSDTYVPVMDDLFNDQDPPEAQVLIALAKYTDGDGAGKFAYAISMNTVKEDTRNRMPMFR